MKHYLWLLFPVVLVSMLVDIKLNFSSYCNIDFPLIGFFFSLFSLIFFAYYYIENNGLGIFIIGGWILIFVINITLNLPIIANFLSPQSIITIITAIGMMIYGYKKDNKAISQKLPG